MKRRKFHILNFKKNNNEFTALYFVYERCPFWSQLVNLVFVFDWSATFYIWTYRNLSYSVCIQNAMIACGDKSPFVINNEFCITKSVFKLTRKNGVCCKRLTILSKVVLDIIPSQIGIWPLTHTIWTYTERYISCQ